jgi:hypothetical protein
MYLANEDLTEHTDWCTSTSSALSLKAWNSITLAERRCALIPLTWKRLRTWKISAMAPDVRKRTALRITHTMRPTPTSTKRGRRSCRECKRQWNRINYHRKSSQRLAARQEEPTSPHLLRE